MNTIGVSCPDFCTTDFYEMLESISKDFSHWEIFSEADHMVQKVSGGFADRAEMYKMTFSIHTDISCVNIAAVNERMREASVMEIVSEMEAAVEMGIDTLTVHPGIINLAVSGTRDRSVRSAKNSARFISRAANEYGLRVCMENMPNVPMLIGTSVEELQEIVDGTDLGVTFDIGHANTLGMIDSMIDTFGDRIGNVHIHDNLGKRDDHLTLGEGNIDFLPIIRRLSRYKGRYIIESLDLLSAVESQKILKNMLQ
ncbi:Sugar phosphate isomerase/epimerase [Thermoplasmatales archaeon BRNA1]|nr:Sugar phosphate isomerase/epimerase [Thermoplasmatales archaeon BRNA1]